MGKDEGYSEGHRILKTSPGSRWGWITEYLFKEWSTATLYYSNQIPSEILQLSICWVTTITEPCNSLTSLVQSFMAKGALLRLSSSLSSLSLKVFSDGDSTISYRPIHKTSFNFWKTKTRVPFSWPVTFLGYFTSRTHTTVVRFSFFLMLKYKATQLNLAAKAIC